MGKKKNKKCRSSARCVRMTGEVGLVMIRLILRHSGLPLKTAKIFRWSCLGLVGWISLCPSSQSKSKFWSWLEACRPHVANFLGQHLFFHWPNLPLNPYFDTLRRFLTPSTRWIFNSDFSPGHLPNWFAKLPLTHVRFLGNIDHHLYPMDMERIISLLPRSLLSFQCDLTFFSWLPFWSHSPRIKGNFPPGLLRLCLGKNFDVSRFPCLPPTLIRLSTGDLFNSCVDDLPCQNLTHLSFGSVFDQPVDHLPSHLTHLIFGRAFDQHVDHLPNQLICLTFGCKFSKPLDYLPASLRHLNLSLAENFLLPLDHLPGSLTHLMLGSNWHHNLDHLPASLKFLWIKDSGFNFPLDHLSSSLIFLSITCFLFNQPLDHLPSSLVHLTLESESFSQSLDHLPSTLSTLNATINTDSFDHLPAQLQRLRLGSSLKGSEVALHHLPTELVELELRDSRFHKSGFSSLFHLPRKLNQFRYRDSKTMSMKTVFNPHSLCLFPTTPQKINSVSKQKYASCQSKNRSRKKKIVSQADRFFKSIEE